MSDQTTPQRPGTSRRDFLRRGAIVGGTLVWAAPAIMTLERAVAQVASPVPRTFWFIGGTSIAANSTTMQETAPGGATQEKEIKKDSGEVLDQDDTTKFHYWQSELGAGAIVGTVTLRLHLRPKDANKRIKIEAVLVDVANNAGPDAGTEIAGPVQHSGTWSGFQERVISFGTVNHTVGGDRRLRMKFVNRDDGASDKSDDDLFVAWNSSVHQSRLEIT